MKAPLSWLKEFVEIDLPLEELANRLTMAGLEVEEIHYVGLPMPAASNEGGPQVTKITGLSWEDDKIVTAEVLEVLPHPNADRLVLCRLNDGQQEHVVLTGAPNLYPYKGQGALTPSLKVAYAKEGSRIYDGHQPGQVLTTLKRARIRGVESYSMICSEKELGISDEHEGVILLDPDAPVGLPLSEYLGDAVLEVAITPNVARDANILGLAREIAALTDKPLRRPEPLALSQGAPVAGKAKIEIRSPELNPRFVLGLIENVTIAESPYKVQHRLRLVGMRPINNIVDATNYAMLEIGEPLHAFDYDVLVERAGGRPGVLAGAQTPTIITRTAQPGERLTTLDGVERSLNDFTVLVTDTAGALSIAGVMGGAESEVTSATRSVLLEGAAWNFINIRRTIAAQKLNSEAAYRFSRGVHPAMAERGVRRGLELMHKWAGGELASGLVDNYPLPPQDPTVEITLDDIRRWLGIELSVDEVAAILYRLEFGVEVSGQTIRAQAPDHRLDIGAGVTGMADLMEEIARVYGYERIPATRMSDELPPQLGSPELDQEERVRDLLAGLGLQEIITYRMTTPSREARLYTGGLSGESGGSLLGGVGAGYVRLLNPIASDRDVLRRSLLSSVLEVAERSARAHERLALFEIGPVFAPQPGGDLPNELARLAIFLSGVRQLPSWQGGAAQPMDFYDLKGVVDGLLASLHIPGVRYVPGEHPSYHPGKYARILAGEQLLGEMGELHPLVKANYDLPAAALLAAELDLPALLQAIPARYDVVSAGAFPPVLEDLAIIVAEDLPAEKVAGLIRQTGGRTLVDLRLFDVFRGEQIGAGLKSLAYSLVYQAPDRTLTAQEVLQIRQRIIRRLEQELGAKLRS